MNAENISIIVSAVIAVIVVVGVFVLLALGLPVPAELWTGFGLILGFFYGHQTGVARARSR